MKVVEILNKSDLDRLDSEVLLAKILSKDRTWLITHSDFNLDKTQESKWKEYSGRRKKGEPVAYIINRAEFYGLDFFVNESVLIPRSATEGLIDLVLDIFKGKVSDETRGVDTQIVVTSKLIGDIKSVKRICDVGTGSGCIAVTLAKQLPQFNFIATDISEAALKVAEQNTQHHKVLDHITFLAGRGLEPVKNLTDPFLLVSNPPYIPSAEPVSAGAAFEPETALFAGPQGTDVLINIWEQAKNNPACRGVVFECREDQVDKVF